MLFLLFHVRENTYACACDSILEIVPRIDLQQADKMPAYIAGLMNYGGNPVPIIDFSRLVGQNPCVNSLNTRIILLSKPNAKESGILGIMAEKVTQFDNLEWEQFSETAMFNPEAPYLGGVMQTPQGMIRIVLLGKLFDYMNDIVISVNQEKLALHAPN